MCYKIRNAGFEDVPVIHALIKQNQEELLLRPISDIMQNIDRFVVCEIDDQIVGAASWEILPELGKITDPSVEFKSVAVLTGFRNKGVGSAMINGLITRVMSFHPTRIIVLTFVPGFFQKLGFVHIRKEELMHKLYTGCINCTKYDSPFTCPEVAMTLVLKKI